MPRSDLRFSLQLGRSGAVLAVDRFVPTDGLVIEALEVEVGLSSSIDTEAGFSRLRDRRGRLRNLSVSLDLAGLLDDWVASLTLPPGLDVLESWVGYETAGESGGTADVSQSGREGDEAAGALDEPLAGPVVFGQVLGLAASGSESVPFVATWHMDHGPDGALLWFDSPLVFGLATAPSWAIAETLVRSVAEALEPLAPPKTVSLCSDTMALSIAPVEWVLWEALVTRGWRLPDGRTAPAHMAWTNGRLRLDSHASQVETPSDGKVWPRTPAHRLDGLGPERVFVLGRHLVEEGRWVDAARYYIDALGRHPQDRFLWQRAVELAVRTGDRRAADLIERMAAKWPDWDFVEMARIWLLDKEGRQAEAAEICERFARNAFERGRPMEARAGLRAAASLWRHHDVARAAAVLEWGLAQGLTDERAEEVLAELYDHLGRWSDLVSLLRRGGSRGSAARRVGRHLALGHVYGQRLDDPLRARSEYEHALRLDPRCGPAWVGLVDSLIASGNLDKAASVLERAGAVVGDEPSGESGSDVAEHLEMARARLLAATGRRSEALQILESRLETASQAWLRILVDLAEQAENWGLEARALDRLCRDAGLGIEGPERLEFLCRLGRLALERLDDVGLAQAAVDEALAVDARHAESLKLAVLLADRRGRFGELAELLSRLVALQPEQAAGLHVRRARVLALELDRLDDGVEILEDLLTESQVEQDPDTKVLVLDTLAELLRAAGRRDRLIEVLTDRVALLESGPHDPGMAVGVYRELAELLLSQGPDSASLARRYLVRAASLVPEDLDTLERLAGLLEQRGAWAELEPVLGRLVEAARRQAKLDVLGRALWATARYLVRLERHRDAADILDESLRLLPSRIDLARFAADVFLRAGLRDRAQAVLEDLWESAVSEGRVEIAVRLAGLLWEEGDRERAVTLYRAALEEGAEGVLRVECRHRLCDHRVERQDWTGAVEEYLALASDERCGIDGEQRAEAVFLAAQVTDRALGDQDEAIELCRRALELDPHHRGAQNMLETAFARAGQWEDVIGVLERKIASAQGRLREQAGLLGRLAKVEFEELGRIEAARRDYRRALAADEDYLPALEFLAADAKRLGELDTSLALYRRIVEVNTADMQDPELARKARKTIAELLVLKEDLEAATEAYEAALDADPADHALLVGLADVLERRGEVQALAGVLRRLAEISRGDDARHTRLHLARVLSESLGQVGQAAEVYRELLRQDEDDMEALAGLEKVLASQQRPVERLKVLSRLAESMSKQDEPPESYESVLVQLGQTALEVGRFAEAIGAVDALAEMGVATRREGQLLLAVAQAAGDEETRARAHAMLVETIEGEERKHWLLVRARHLFEVLGRTQAALEVLKDEQAEGPEFDLLEAQCLEAEQQWGDAAGLYRRLADAFDTGDLPTDGEESPPVSEEMVRHRLFELALDHIEDWACAEKQGVRLLELDPDDEEVVSRLSSLYRRLGKWVEVRRLVERRLKIVRQAGDIDAEHDVSLELASLWKLVLPEGLERAERLCRRALELRPDSLEALRVLAEVQAARGALGAAAETLETLVETGRSRFSNEELGAFHLEAARLFVGMDDGSDSAMEHFRAAVRMLEDASRIRAADEWLEAALGRSRWSEAGEAAEILRDLRGDRADLERLALAYEKLGRFDEAVSVVRRLLELHPTDQGLKARLKGLLEQAGRHFDLASTLESEAQREDSADLFLEAASHYLASAEGREQAVVCLAEAWRRGALGAPDLLDRVFLQENPRVDDLVSQVLSERGVREDLALEAAKRRLAREASLDRTSYDWLVWAVAKEVDGAADLLERALVDNQWHEELRRLLVSRLPAVEDPDDRARLVMRIASLDLGHLSQPAEAAALLLDEMDSGRIELDEAGMELLFDALVGSDQEAEAEEMAAGWARQSRDARLWFGRAAKLARARGDDDAEARWLVGKLGAGSIAEDEMERLLELAESVADLHLDVEVAGRLVENASDLDVRLTIRALDLVERAEDRYELGKNVRQRLGVVTAPFIGWLAHCALEAGRIEEALELMAEQYQTIDPGQRDQRAALSAAMADVLYEQGQDAAAAADMYRRSADEAADSALRRSALEAVVRMARLVEDPAGEEEALRLLVEMEAAGDDGLLRLLELTAAREAWGDALELYSIAARRGLVGPEHLPIRAAALEGLGRWREAAQAWREAGRAETDRGADHMLRAAVVLRDRCRDASGAVAVMAEVLTRWPHRRDVEALVEALCKKHELWAELVDVERIVLKSTEEPRQRAKLLHSMAVVTDRKLGRPDEAAALLAEAVAVDPSFSPVYRPLGEYHYRRREWAPAEEYLRRALEDPELDGARRSSVMKLLAKVLRATERFDEELDLLIEAVDVDPDDRDLWQSAMDAARRAQRPGRAVDLLLGQADRVQGRARAELLARAASLCEVELGDVGRAVDLYAAAVELSPELDEPRARLLDLLRDRGDCEPLRKRLEAELVLAQTDADRTAVAAELAALCEGPCGDEDAAERYLRMAHGLQPQDLRWIRMLSDFLARRKRWTDLASLLEDVLDTAGMEIDNWGGLMALLGRTYLEKLSEPDKALSVFERARARGVLTERSAALLASLYQDRGRYEELIRLLREQLEQEQDPDERKLLISKLAEVLDKNLGQKKEAAEELARCFLDHEDLDAGVEARRLFLAAGAGQQALAVARLLVARCEPADRPGHQEALGLLLAEQAGATDEALEVLEEALSQREDLPHAHMVVGSILFERGEIEPALEHLEAYLEGASPGDPDLARVHGLVARAALEAKDRDKALVHFEQALVCDPTRVEWFSALAKLYEQAERWDALDAVLARWLVLEPDPRRRAELWLQRALIHRDHRQDGAEAVRCLKEAVALRPKFGEATHVLREMLEEQGDYAQAVRLLRRELDGASGPKERTDLLLHLGQILERHLHRPHDAVESYRRAVNVSPRDQAALSHLVRMCSLMGRWAEAASVQERLADVTDDPRGLVRSARLYMRAKSYREAVRVWIHLLVEGPDALVSESAAGLESCLEDGQEGDEGLEMVIEALDGISSGDRRQVLLRAAVAVLVHRGRLEEAEPFVAELLDADADDAGVFAYRVRLLEERREYDELARLLLARISSAHDEDVRPWLWQLGQLQRRNLGRPELAMETFRRLVDLSPDDTAAVGILAQLASEAGDFETVYQQYHRLDRESGGLDVGRLLELAEAAEALGREQEALECYERVFADDPDNKEALEAMVRLALLSQDRGRAVEALERLMGLLPVSDLDGRLEAGRLLVKLHLAEGRPDLAAERIEDLSAVAADDTGLTTLAVDTYAALADWRRTLEALDRLAGLEVDPAKKARIFYRRAKVAHDRLGLIEEAVGSLLKAVDLDPRFLPPWVELSICYLRQGQWDRVVEVCDAAADLFDGGQDDSSRDIVILRRAVALLLLGGEEAAAVPGLLRALGRDAVDVGVVTELLADAAQGLRDKGLSSGPLGRVLDAFGSVFGGDLVEQMYRSLDDMLITHPDALGARRVFLRVSPRVGHRAMLSEHQKLMAFLDPEDPVVRDQYETLVGGDPMVSSLDVMGPLVSEDLRCPLRTVLVRLADLLSGFLRSEPDRFEGERPLEDAVAPIVAAKVAGTVRKLRVRAVDIRVFDSDRPQVHMLDWRPQALLLSEPVFRLEEQELFFLVGRSLEWIRSGTAFLDGRSVEEIDEILVAVGRALGLEGPEGTRVRPELVEILAQWGLNPEAVDRRDQDAVVTALAAHWRSPCDYAAYVASQRRLCQRVGLLVSGDLAASLRAAAVVEAGPRILAAEAVESRRRLVRESSALQELFRFGVSRLRERLHKVTRIGY